MATGNETTKTFKDKLAFFETKSDTKQSDIKQGNPPKQEVHAPEREQHNIPLLDDQVDGKRPEQDSKQENDFQVSGRRLMSTTPTHKSSIEGEVENASKDIEKDSESYSRATLIDVKQVLHEIRGVAHLPYLIPMCDTVDSKLMIFDTEFNLRFEHTCPMLPFDVSALNDTTVVVSSIGKCWSLFSIGADKMYCIERIGTAGRCYGICCHKWEIFCIVGEKSSHRRRLNVYAADGRLKRYKYLEDGNQVFDQSEYIGINAKTDILYMSPTYLKACWSCL